MLTYIFIYEYKITRFHQIYKQAKIKYQNNASFTLGSVH